jgi:hypothetical protein
MSDLENKKPEMIGVWAGTLALTEVGLGSAMHALHLPLAGTMLSLNQAAFLTRAVRIQKQDPAVRSLAFEISAVTAILKSFAPVGKRLTPMLAITAQGALFTTSIYIFGCNLLGVVLGSVLLATWGVLQPVALAGVMFWALSANDQETIIKAWGKLTAELPFMNVDNIGMAVAGFLAVKCVAAATISMATWKLPQNKRSNWFTRWVHQLSDVATNRPLPLQSSKGAYPLIQALRDLRQPLIILSVGLLVGLALLVESNLVAAIWIGLRALAVAYATYVLLRLLPWEAILNGNSSTQRALRAAISHLRGMNTNAATDSATSTREVDA